MVILIMVMVRFMLLMGVSTAEDRRADQVDDETDGGDEKGLVVVDRKGISQTFD